MVSFSQRYAVLAVLLLICGCYHHPYQNQGWQGQPGYYPAQPGLYQTPGQLYVPPSNGALVVPGTELLPYDADAPIDDFKNSDRDKRFFDDEDSGGVPAPRGSSGSGFDDDYFDGT